jgi:hypothetical protein
LLRIGYRVDWHLSFVEVYSGGGGGGGLGSPPRRLGAFVCNGLVDRGVPITLPRIPRERAVYKVREAYRMMGRLKEVSLI